MSRRRRRLFFFLSLSLSLSFLASYSHALLFYGDLSEETEEKN